MIKSICFLSMIVSACFIAAGVGYKSIDMILFGAQYALISSIAFTVAYYWSK